MNKITDLSVVRQPDKTYKVVIEWVDHMWLSEYEIPGSHFKAPDVYRKEFTIKDINKLPEKLFDFQMSDEIGMVVGRWGREDE